jgi:RNA-binding protein Tab2/Atab2
VPKVWVVAEHCQVQVYGHLQLQEFLPMMMSCLPLMQGKIFGDTFPLAAAGAGGLPPDALVPGIAVFSRRAEALAAWTSGVELASVSADTDRACLILETGVNDRFRC